MGFDSIQRLLLAKATCPVLGGSFQKETLFLGFFSTSSSVARLGIAPGRVAKRAGAGVPPLPPCFVGWGESGCLSAPTKGGECPKCPGGKLRCDGFAVCLSKSFQPKEIMSPASSAGDKIRFPFSGPSGPALGLFSIVQTHQAGRAKNRLWVGAWEISGYPRGQG